MHEVELKFIIPPARLEALTKQVAIKSSKTQQLDAYYFDTPKQALGLSGIAIRIRNENGNWVQTVKAKGDGLAKRIEENIELPENIQQHIGTSTFVPDLSLHSDDIIALFESVMPIKTLQKQLTLKFSTEVTRITRLIKAGNNCVEVAFDKGKLSSGDHSDEICEIEFELLQGDIDFLIETAKKWVSRYQLHYSTLSKAGAGARLFALANNHTLPSAVVKADTKTLSFHKHTTQDNFIRRVVQNCLQHLLPNLTELASANELQVAEQLSITEHIHQARVAMRRLRVALSQFTDFSDDIDTAWLEPLKQCFLVLGDYRDKQLLIEQTEPLLREQGAPAVNWQMPPLAEIQQAVTHKNLQMVLLDMIAFASNADDDILNKKTTCTHLFAKPFINKQLEKLFKRIIKDSEHFAALSIEEKHDVRKRLKKLRYLCEFVRSLYENKHCKPKEFSKFVKPAQNVLGEFNDASFGYMAYLTVTELQPQAWFAVGYFKALEQRKISECETAIKTIKFAPAFWRD